MDINIANTIINKIKDVASTNAGSKMSSPLKGGGAEKSISVVLMNKDTFSMVEQAYLAATYNIIDRKAVGEKITSLYGYYIAIADWLSFGEIRFI